MDIFDIHHVKVEKANAMQQYRRFRKIARFFRLIELFLAVVLLSWISTRLPFVVRISGEYFRQLLSIIVSPLFIFLIGNVIVLTLVIKSGHLTGTHSAVDNAGTDLYEDIVNNVTQDAPIALKHQEIVYQDKQIISQLNFNGNEIKVTTEAAKKRFSDLDLKIYRRSQSENLMKTESEIFNGKMKRSETEIGRRKVESPAVEEDDDVDNVVDELSNEEFQKKIEGFIAKQLRFHKQEKLAIVPHNLI